MRYRLLHVLLQPAATVSHKRVVLSSSQLDQPC